MGAVRGPPFAAVRGGVEELNMSLGLVADCEPDRVSRADGWGMELVDMEGPIKDHLRRDRRSEVVLRFVLEARRGGIVYSSAMTARGKLGANDSC